MLLVILQVDEAFPLNHPGKADDSVQRGAQVEFMISAVANLITILPSRVSNRVYGLVGIFFSSSSAVFSNRSYQFPESMTR